MCLRVAGVHEAPPVCQLCIIDFFEKKFDLKIGYEMCGLLGQSIKLGQNGETVTHFLREN